MIDLKRLDNNLNYLKDNYSYPKISLIDDDYNEKLLKKNRNYKVNKILILKEKNKIKRFIGVEVTNIYRF
jgi:hypothetical protein